MECPYCNQNPCLWDVYEESLKEELNNWLETIEDKNPTNNVIRKKCYHLFTALHHGYLGRKKRERIPTCVTTAIREVYPDCNGHYMGFKDE